MQLALNNRIAIWDVLKACIREGSSDSAINSEVPNDFNELRKSMPKLRKLCFNGKKAFEYYQNYVSDFSNLPKVVLPSTSSANNLENIRRKT